jgi:hypothetical protein
MNTRNPLIAAGGVLLAFAACGGRAAPVGDVSEPVPPAPTPVEVTPADVRDVRCPAAVPKNATACSPDALPPECHYSAGTGVTVAICTREVGTIICTPGPCPPEAYGTWWIYSPPNDGSPNPSACPNTFAAVGEGAACPQGAQEGLACNYDEGVCACTTDRMCGTEWKCRSRTDVPSYTTLGGAGPHCPAVRAEAGTACTREDEVCNYLGDICFDHGLLSLGPVMRCAHGLWQADEPISSCPGMGGCPTTR